MFGKEGVAETDQGAGSVIKNRMAIGALFSLNELGHQRKSIIQALVSDDRDCIIHPAGLAIPLGRAHFRVHLI